MIWLSIWYKILFVINENRTRPLRTLVLEGVTDAGCLSISVECHKGDLVKESLKYL